MNPSRPMVAALLATLCWCSGLEGRAAEPPDRPPTGADLEGLAARCFDLTDAVLTHHVDPPTRQQMLLAGFQALYRNASLTPPADLARRASRLATAEDLGGLLRAVWPRRRGVPEPSDRLEEAFLDGLLAAVPGEARLVSDKELRVETQIAANMYVGIHVQIGLDRKEKQPEFIGVIEGGPADQAGIRKGERIAAIDGLSTVGQPLTATIDRLRGPEGTSVVLQVVDPDSRASRTVTIRRGLLPQKTISGVSSGPGKPGLLIPGTRRIGYLHVEQIAGSTPRELRVLARQLEDEGARGLVLDLRQVYHASLHPTALLADALLEDGRIGRVRWAERVETFSSDADVLLPGMPLAVLIDRTTPSLAAWLAAALRDHRRAVLVGEAAVVDGRARTTVPLARGGWSVTLETGRLERGDGRPIGEALPPSPLVLTLREPRFDPPRNAAGRGLKPDFPVVRTTPRSTASTGPAVLADPFVTEAVDRLESPVDTERTQRETSEVKR